MHRHDESKKGLPLAAVEAPFSANVETIAAGTELALLELGIGASGGDHTQDFVENRKSPVRRRRLVLLLQQSGELGDMERCIYRFPTLELYLVANFFIESKVGRGPVF